jgi:hypothetical protein
MTIPLATSQYLATTGAIATANAAADAVLATKHSDLLTQITTAATLGLYNIAYDTVGLTDTVQIIAMLQRYGYTVIQTGTVLTISWLTSIPTSVTSSLPTNAKGVLTNNGSGVLTWVNPIPLNVAFSVALS